MKRGARGAEPLLQLKTAPGVSRHPFPIGTVAVGATRMWDGRQGLLEAVQALDMLELPSFGHFLHPFGPRSMS